MKGISSIIATLLMLIVTIGLAALAYSYIMGIWGSRITQTFQVVEVYNDTVTIMNSGSNAITELKGTIYSSSMDAVLQVTPIDSSLVAYWHFDEGYGSVTKDDSGNNNDGNFWGGNIIFLKYGGYGGHPTDHNGLINDYNYNDLKEKRIVTEINNANYGDLYNMLFTTWFYVEKEGNWWFAIDGDDAVEAEIDGTVVAYWYGGHGFCNCYDHNGQIYLSKGWHKLIVRHEEDYGGDGVILYFKAPGDTDWKVFSVANLVGRAGVAYLPIPSDQILKSKIFVESGIDKDYISANRTDGKFGKALSFDGVDDYVKIPDSPSLDITNAITVEAWVNPSSYVEWGGIVSKGVWGAPSPYLSYALDTKAGGYFKFSLDWGVETVVSRQHSTNTWYHVVGTWDGTTAKIYVNGVLEGQSTRTGSLNLNDGILAIGVDHPGGVEYFNGIIDEVRIYNRALSEEEIKAHASSNVGVAIMPGQTAKVKVLNVPSKGGHTLKLCTPNQCQTIYLTII